MVTKNKIRKSFSSLLTGGSKWAFVIFVFLPLIYTFITAFSGKNELLSNLQQIKSDSLLLLLKSGGIAFASALLSTLLGTIIGFILYKTHIRFNIFFKLALLIPLFISPYILAVAWKDFFFLIFNDTGPVMSGAGVIWVLTTIYTPLSILISGSAFAGIDSQIEESAIMIAGFRKAMIKVILPLIKPALLSSFVLVFIFSISEFSVPAFFGIKVFTTEIFTQFSAFYNHSLAVLQSSLLILICIFLLIGEKEYLSEAPFISIGTKGTKTRLYQNKKLSFFGSVFVSGWFFVSVLTPFIVLIIQSVSGGGEQLIKAFDLLKPTFAASFGLAFTGAVIILIIGFAAALASVKNSNQGKKNYFDMLLLIAFASPSIILGISLIKFYNHPALNFIYSSFAIIVIGYAGKFTFISAKLIANAIKQIPRSLDEAAQITGIPERSRLWKVLIPLTAPALFSAFIISFIFSLGELGTTIMVYPPGTEIMPIKVFTIMANAPQSLTSSMTLIVFSVTLLLISIFYLSGKWLFKSNAPD